MSCRHRASQLASFGHLLELGPWAAQPSVESAGGMEALPRWTAEGCALAATSTTRPLCGTSPDCYWCRFKKQKSSHLFVSFDVNVTSSGSSVRCTKIDGLNNVDFVSSNANSSGQEALLYIFEDKEAVIKSIIKGRSPTMTHVSRTHRVALDWLIDRINLDPKIQIKCIDTKNQLADMLTKGNFTRDEWNHLLCLFNISLFSSINSFNHVRRQRCRVPLGGALALIAHPAHFVRDPT